MKFRISIVLTLAALTAACAPRYAPAPVTGWDSGAAPAGTTVRVARGDTVSGIAARYGVSTHAIIEANHLVYPYWLEVGQTLTLPGARTAYASNDVPAYAAVPPPPPSRYRSWQQSEPPPTRTAGAPPSAAAPSAARIDSREVAPSEEHATRMAEAATAKPAPVRTATAAIAPPVHEAVPPGASGAHGFIWPVRGRVLEGYGAGRNGIQNDGINIAAPAGAPVYAAAAGEVVYVGNELRGYGNLVLIKHDDGFLTAYAHNSVLLVHKGEHVARGQTIGRVGATGQVSEPQLHFEIRRGRSPVDPMQFLPPEQQASIGE